MSFTFLEEIGRAFTPRAARPGLRKYLLKAGITKEPYTFFGLLFFFSLGVTFAIYITFFWQFFLQLQQSLDRTTYLVVLFFGTLFLWTIILLTISGLLIVFIYFYIDLKIYNRTRMMEEILPDFLELVSANLKGGYSFEKALWASIKPRFGILSHEIAIAAKKVMTGGDVEDALNEFAEKYDSPTLKRTAGLIVGEVQSGGKISDIIDGVVENLKKTKVLKEEMSASVITYMIFIAAVVIVISPILFALSLNLLQVIQNVTGLISTSTAHSQAAMPITFRKMDVNPHDFVVFSHLALLIIATFSSMIVSIIEKGSIKGGIKYVPIFIFLSQFFYFVCLKVMGFLFGKMIRL
ncbi:MAG: type II secretion system F family protein [Candidatus Woesearchaeota archaeon]